MFGSAWLTDGWRVSIAQINEAASSFAWVKAVFWDITLFNIFVCGWIIFRERILWKALLGCLAFWASGSVFLGLYCAVILANGRSVRRLLVGSREL